MRAFAALTVCCAIAAALSVLGAEAQVAPCEPGDTPVSISGFNYSPSSVQVLAGTTICWTNSDPFEHTVTSNSPGFDSGQLAPGSLVPAHLCRRRDVRLPLWGARAQHGRADRGGHEPATAAATTATALSSACSSACSSSAACSSPALTTPGCPACAPDGDGIPRRDRARERASLAHCPGEGDLECSRHPSPPPAKQDSGERSASLPAGLERAPPRPPAQARTRHVRRPPHGRRRRPPLHRPNSHRLASPPCGGPRFQPSRPGS